MQSVEGLTERQFKVLEAVIQIFVETAQPAGSQAVAKRSRLGISPASVRSTMGELETRGFLFHAHTSGGRIPTDRGYRLYVNRLMRPAPVPQHARAQLERDSSRIPQPDRRDSAPRGPGAGGADPGAGRGHRADAGRAGPGAARELVRVSSERLLAVLTLQSGLVRTFRGSPRGGRAVVEHVSRVLNERLAGLALREIRGSMAERLRDADTAPRRRAAQHLRGPGRRALRLFGGESSLVLGSAQPLADQPEFASTAGCATCST